MSNVADFFADRQVLLALVFVAGGFVVGLFVEIIVRSILKRIWLKRGWAGWTTVKKGLRGMITLWFVIAGLYTAIRIVEMEAGIKDVFEKALLVLIIFTITLVIARITAGLVDLYITRAEGSMPSTTIMGNVIRIVVMLTGILVILMILEVPIAPILTALGVSGLVVALAFQDTLSNLFSGLQILASKKISPGDYIELDTGEEGWVIDITWRNSTVRTVRDNVVLIPNAKMASAIVTNYNTLSRESSVFVDVGVSYDSDLKKVEEATKAVAREVLDDIEGGVSSFEPSLYYKRFSESSIDFTVVLRVREYMDHLSVTHEFIKRLHDRYAEEGITIPFPMRTVQLQPLGERQA